MGGSMLQKKQQIIPMAPLVEGPDPDLVVQYHFHEDKKIKNNNPSSSSRFREWFRNKKQQQTAAARSSSGRFGTNSSHYAGQLAVGEGKDMRLLLGVLACPLAPIPLLLDGHDDPLHLQLQLLRIKQKNIPVHAEGGGLAARYINQQYLAATGCLDRKKRYKNMYTTGDVRMTYCETEISTITAAAAADEEDSTKVKRLGTRSGESGCFVLWMMSPAMWSLELVVGGSKVVAGSDSNIVWRHTPWLGTHAAKGPQRPLRRIIQGLDPKITAKMFTKSEYMGEDTIGDDSCFVLKVEADRDAIKERSEGSAEVIRHTLYGYFSQKSGLLIYMEDSHLTRVASGDEDDTAVYWETTIGSSITDYRAVDGVLIAHQGRTIATVFKFGDEAMEYSRTRLEEEWTINDVAFDVPGLSLDYFIPPADIFANLNSSSH